MLLPWTAPEWNFGAISGCERWWILKGIYMEIPGSITEEIETVTRRIYASISEGVPESKYFRGNLCRNDRKLSL